MNWLASSCKENSYVVCKVCNKDISFLKTFFQLHNMHLLLLFYVLQFLDVSNFLGKTLFIDTII